MKKPMFINRELSWLGFNERVLFQALDPRTPLVERAKFIGITENNLDEFIRVRLSSVLNDIENDPNSKDINGKYLANTMKTILTKLYAFKKYQEDVSSKVIEELKEEDIILLKYDEVGKAIPLDQLKQAFNSIYPLITTIAYDTTAEFPFIHSSQLTGILILKKDGIESLVVIPLDHLPRMFKFKTKNKKTYYVLLEDIMRIFMTLIIGNVDLLYFGLMRVHRSADIELNKDDNRPIVDRMEDVLTRREKGAPIILEVSHTMPKKYLELIQTIYMVQNKFIYKQNTHLDYKFMFGFETNHKSSQVYNVKKGSMSEAIAYSKKNMFKNIDRVGEIVMHHPEDMFMNVIDFINKASLDDQVLAIRQTLYRVSSENSDIINALCRAADSGKQVSVIIELKARFDEKQNIKLIDKLKSHGCTVILGLDQFKVHSKFTIVVRRTKKDKLKIYSHVSTGNYNEKTSSIYTDIGIITSSEAVGQDLITLFNTISGVAPLSRDFKRISVAPFCLRERLYKLIKGEIEAASKGKPASIVIKVNSISDREIIEKLYNASEKGVKVTMIVRGVCSMKPINGNIKIMSFIGKYLEHSRIFKFQNGGKNSISISSADLLTRNLDRRFEVLMPIDKKHTHNRIDALLNRYMCDKNSRFVMDSDGSYHFVEGNIMYD